MFVWSLSTHPGLLHVNAALGLDGHFDSDAFLWLHLLGRSLVDLPL